MALDRLSYLVSLDPTNATQGLNKIGLAAKKNVAEADAEIAKLQRNIDRLNAKSIKLGRGGDSLGADVAKIQAQDLEASLASLSAPASTLGGKLAGVGLGAQTLAAGAGLASVAVIKLGVDAAFSADKLETARRGTDAVFKGQAKDVRAFAAEAAGPLAQSEVAALQASNAFGNLFVKAGVAAPQAAKFAQGLTTLASVLAAAHPEAGTTSDALVALQASFRGEFDPLEKFAVKVNQTAVGQKALQLGLSGSTASLTEQDKQLATLQLLFEKTNIEQGLFAQNSESLAFKGQKAAASLQNIKDQVGGGLSEDVGNVSGAFAGLTGYAERFSGVKLDGPLKAIKDVGPLGLFSALARSLDDATTSGRKAGGALAHVNDLNIKADETRKRANASVQAGIDRHNELFGSLEASTGATKRNTDAVETQAQVEAKAAAVTLSANEAALTAAKSLESADTSLADAKKAVVAANQSEADAVLAVADAQQKLDEARRKAPEDRTRAEIAARSAQRAVGDAQKELDKVLRRRGADDPKTQDAQDKLTSATLDSADAQQTLNDLRLKGPQAVQSAEKAVDAALRNQNQAVDAQRTAVDNVRKAEDGRARSAADLNTKLISVTGEIRHGLDATTATRQQVDGIVAGLQRAVDKQVLFNDTAAAGARSLHDIFVAADAALAKAEQAKALGGLLNPAAGPGPAPVGTGTVLRPGAPVGTGTVLRPGAGTVGFALGAAAAQGAAKTTIQNLYTGDINVNAADTAAFQRSMEEKARLARLGGG